MSHWKEREVGWTGRDQDTMTPGPGKGDTVMEAGTQPLVGTTMIMGLVGPSPAGEMTITMRAMAITGGEIMMTVTTTGEGDGVMTATTIRNRSMILSPITCCNASLIFFSWGYN